MTNENTITLEICTGTTCFILGAAELEALEQQVNTRWPGKVNIKPSRCLGLCKSGHFYGAPYVRINNVPIGKANTELIIHTIEEMLGNIA